MVGVLEGLADGDLSRHLDVDSRDEVGDMARALTEAAAGAGDIARNIGGVAQAAQETTGGAGETAQAAGTLSRMAGELQDLVGRFGV